MSTASRLHEILSAKRTKAKVKKQSNYDETADASTAEEIIRIIEKKLSSVLYSDMKVKRARYSEASDMVEVTLSVDKGGAVLTNLHLMYKFLLDEIIKKFDIREITFTPYGTDSMKLQIYLKPD